MKKFLFIFLFPVSVFADDGQCHVTQVGANGYQIVCEGDGINYGYETITNHVIYAENCNQFKQQLESYAANELSSISFACGNGSSIDSDSINCSIEPFLQTQMFYLYNDLNQNFIHGDSSPWPGDTYLRISDFIDYDYNNLTNLLQQTENKYESNYRQLKSTYNTITNLQCSTCDNSGGSSGGSGGGECCTDYSQQFSTIITRLSQIKEGIYNAETNLVSIEEAIYEKLYKLTDESLSSFFNIYTNYYLTEFFTTNQNSRIGISSTYFKQGITAAVNTKSTGFYLYNTLPSLLYNFYSMYDSLSSINNYLYFNLKSQGIGSKAITGNFNSWSSSTDNYQSTTNITSQSLLEFKANDNLGPLIAKFIYNSQNLQLNINESLVRIAKSVANGPDSDEEKQQFEHDLEEADFEGNQQQLIDSFDQQTAQQLTTDSFLSSQTINSAFQNTLPQFGESLPSVVTIAIPRWGDGSAQDSLVFTINIQDYHWFFNLIRATVRFFYYGLFAFFIYWLFKWFLIFLKWIWGLLQSTHIG